MGVELQEQMWKVVPAALKMSVVLPLLPAAAVVPGLAVVAPGVARLVFLVLLQFLDFYCKTPNHIQTSLTYCANISFSADGKCTGVKQENEFQPLKSVICVACVSASVAGVIAKGHTGR